MKISVRIIQIIVAVLFIISGLVKANDPLGLTYKMQEFFEIWNTSLTNSHFFAKGMLISLFNFFHEHSLFLSIMMIILEIVAGIALLLGWRKKFVLYSLLVLIIFFTFLTGYALLSKNPDGSLKFTNCGCFGDCLPIPPVASFTKDLVLLAMIIFLIMGQKYIVPLFSKQVRTTLVVSSLLLSLLLQIYVLNYLPLVDCLPFKKGNNIAEQMKPPPGSIPDSIGIRFIYEKNGKRFEFAPENLPPDYNTYKYIDRIDKLIRKGNSEPKIKGFSLSDTSGQDYTQPVLYEPLAVILFAIDTSNSNKWLNDLKRLSTIVQKENIPVYFATSNPAQFINLFNQNNVPVPVFACDFTVIRTAARTNPTLYILKKGTIEKKYSFRNLIYAIPDLKKLKSS